jgi:hypothetical protein
MHSLLAECELDAWQPAGAEMPARPRDCPALQEAAVRHRETLTLAEALGMRPLPAHCHLERGTLHLKTGQCEPARAKLSTATALYCEWTWPSSCCSGEAALAQAEWREGEPYRRLKASNRHETGFR